MLSIIAAIALFVSACASTISTASPPTSGNQTPTAGTVSSPPISNRSPTAQAVSSPTSSIQSPTAGAVTMTQQPGPTPSGARPDASTEVAVAGGRARVTCRALQSNTLAGAPIEVEVVFENLGRAPIFLAVGTDRARLRPAYFGFTASLDGSKLDFADPLSSVPDLGGPRTTVKIDPAGSYPQMVLLNEFVSLEKVRDALAPGASGTLRVTCQRLLTVGTTETEALSPGAKTPSVDVALVLPVQRDDKALVALMAGLAAKISADRGTNASAAREQATAELVSLRQPEAVPYLEGLRDHPDPAVQARVKQALAAAPSATPTGGSSP